MASFLPRYRPLLWCAAQSKRLRLNSPSIRHAQNSSNPTGPERSEARTTPKSTPFRVPQDKHDEDLVARYGWDYKEKLRARDERIARGELTEEEVEARLNAEDDELDYMEMPVDKSGFFAIDETTDVADDPEFDQDDITSMAHAELEQHRELREFYRIIAWDMPLLYNHRKEFIPPTAEQPLRFRYTTYMGDNHPAARKVVCDFTPSALPDLTQIQVNKLIKILGVRYNPIKDSAKLSCEMFPTPAQNKRYLGDLIDRLINEAKNGEDTFEDIPFDFRHAKIKRKIEFPEEWKMTEERQRMLDAKRAQAEKNLLEAKEQGRLVEGAKIVQENFAVKKQPRRDALPVSVQQQQQGTRSSGPQRQRTTLR